MQISSGVGSIGQRNLQLTQKPKQCERRQTVKHIDIGCFDFFDQPQASAFRMKAAGTPERIVCRHISANVILCQAS